MFRNLTTNVSLLHSFFSVWKINLCSGLLGMTMSLNVALWFLMIQWTFDWSILAMAESQFCFDKKRKNFVKKFQQHIQHIKKNIFYINMLKESYLSKLCFNNCKLSHFSAKYLDCYGRWNLYKQMNNSHWDKEIVIKITITASLETTNATESSASTVIEHAVSVMHSEL